MKSTHHHVVPDIELSVLVEQRLLDVFLYDVGFLGTVEVLFFLFQNAV